MQAETLYIILVSICSNKIAITVIFSILYTVTDKSEFDH